MRVVGGIVVLSVLAAAVGIGCRAPGGPTNRLRPEAIARSLSPMIPPEALLVASVLLERPIADPFLDRELWDVVLPVGEPETRSLLAENGLRAGVLSGTVPQCFQDLLASDTETVGAHQRSFNSRKETVIPTSEPADPCRFQLLSDLAGKPKLVELKQARCGFLIKPQVVEGGRIRVACEPQIQHGQRRDRYRPTADGTALARIEEMPLETFPKLTFEVTLAADDYLLIGWNADQAETLGAAFFGVEVANRPRQRVLVIRARQNGRSPKSDLPAIVGPYRR